MNWRKIFVYTLFSCLFSWIIIIPIIALDWSIEKVPTKILISSFYMWGPLLAVLFVKKIIYKESFEYLKWNKSKINYRFLFWIPIIFIAFILLGLSTIFIMENISSSHKWGELVFSNDGIISNMQRIAGDKASKIEKIVFLLKKIPSSVFFLINILQAVIAGGIFNIPFVLGEEVGWRGFLLEETKPLGFFKSSLIIGLIWGFWHTPLILLGLNYKKSYDFFAVIIMVLSTICFSPIFSYIKLKSNSILGACIFHGMINASAGMFLIFVSNQDLIYSSVCGVAGSIALFVLSTIIYFFDKESIKKVYIN